MVNIPDKDRCDHCGQSLEGAGKDELQAKVAALEEGLSQAVTEIETSGHGDMSDTALKLKRLIQESE